MNPPMDEPTTAALMDPSLWLTLGVILFLLLLSAFFSGAETALTAASRARLSSQADDGSTRAALALKLTQDGERLNGSLLLGNSFVTVLAAGLAALLAVRHFGEAFVPAAALAMTVLVVIVSEVLPKTYAIQNAEAVAARVAPAVALCVRLLAPAVAVLRWIVRGMLWVFGVRIDPSRHVLSIREEIVGTLEFGQSEGTVEKEDRDRLLGALDLRERTVEEIMRHRSDIELIDAATPPEEILAKALQSPHTRLPVFRDDPENIVGVIHAKDLLRAAHGPDGLRVAAFDILQLARKPYFVPETTTLDDQMRQFLKRHTHFALVVDEYGDLQGLITLEDILEEIVGEITDEFDDGADGEIARTADGKFLVDGAMTIRDLNRARDWNLPDDEANTVAGLVIHEAQTIPEAGQVFIFHGFRFEIVERDHNRVTRIKIAPVKPAA